MCFYTPAQIKIIWYTNEFAWKDLRENDLVSDFRMNAS